MHDCVKLVPIFQTLSTQALTKVTELVHEQVYEKGETLFLAGDEASQLTIVAHGQVKVYQGTANGREQLLYLLQAGDFDGEAALFKQDQHTNSATALVTTQVCSIARADFQQLLQQEPQLALNLVNAFGERINQLEHQTTAASIGSIEGRLADFLVETAANFPGKSAFTLPLPKKDIAVYLGTTPETISRKLHQFEQQGWIKRLTANQLIVVDPDALALVGQ